MRVRLRPWLVESRKLAGESRRECDDSGDIWDSGELVQSGLEGSCRCRSYVLATV